MSQNDFECYASKGVKSPAKAMFDHTKSADTCRYYVGLHHGRPNNESCSRTGAFQVSEGRLLSNGYAHEFNRLELRRLATFVVNRRRTNLPVSSELLHDSKIRTGLEQIGHEASPEVMA
jgi:hypothetical protein